MHEVDTRDVILETAEELFAERGYRGLSMRELAREAGVSKANLYYHFTNKRELYLRILERALDTLQLQLTQAAATPGTAGERLTRIVNTYFDLLQRKRSLIHFLMRDIGGFESEVHNLMIERWEDLLRPIEDVIEDGVASGELRPINPRLTALSLTAMLRSAIALQFLTGNTEVNPILAEHMLDLLFLGIEARQKTHIT